MPVRGTRGFMSPKRGSAKAMFSGSDRSGPELGLLNSALKPSNNLGGMKNSVKASDNASLRHQKHYGKGS